MKNNPVNPYSLFVHLLLLVSVLSLMINSGAAAQRVSAEGNTRISFVLKNTLGYHRMFRVEGPGIAYGFTMNRREMVPCHWPVGAKLYFSQDGETTGKLILTITAADEGKTLMTWSEEPEPKKAVQKTVADKQMQVRFRNNSLLPRKVAIITYKPGESGNGTRIMTLLPYSSTKQRLPVGTKVYFATSKQVRVVMSGQALTDKPSLVVGKDDNEETFDIW